MLTIKDVEGLGFKLISNDKQWCHFIGHSFDVTINFDTRTTAGNKFNFKSRGNAFKGNFSAKLDTIEEFKFILRVIC